MVEALFNSSDALFADGTGVHPRNFHIYLQYVWLIRIRYSY